MSRWLFSMSAVAGLFMALLVSSCQGQSSRADLDAESDLQEQPPGAVAAGSEQPAAAQTAQCRLSLQVAGPQGPLSGQKLELRAMRQVSERSWESVAESSLVTAEDGSADALLPCDTRLSLSSSGWMWANQPDRLVLREGMGPIEVSLVPELTVRLYVHGGKGPKPEDVRFHRPGDERGQPVPHDGLVIPGLRMSEPAGEIRSANLPTRLWRPSRSDELEQVRPGVHDAVVIIGDVQNSWLQLDGSLKAEVEGALCLVDGKRGGKCIFHKGVWRCPCPPSASLGLYGPRWDVAFVRPFGAPDLYLEELPEAEELCVRLPQVRATGSTLTAQPAGVSGGLLLGGLPRPVDPGSQVCFRVPGGASLDFRLQGPVEGAWSVVAQGQGSIELQSP